MSIRRSIPPVGSPLEIKRFLSGLAGLAFPERRLASVEGELREYLGVKHVFLVSSGKAAMYVTLKAMKSLSPGRSKVIIPAYTCFSVPSAVYKAGLRIVPCDSDPDTLDFDFGQLAGLVDKQTLCVIPNHLFGSPSDMDSVQKTCKGKGAFILEDAAQAMGSTYKGRLAGTMGDAGFFSFGRGKNISCGGGGAIITDSDEIAKAVTQELAGAQRPGLAESASDLAKTVLTSILIRPSLYWLPSGLPFLELGKTFFYRDFPVKMMSGMKAGLLKDLGVKLKADNIKRLSASSFYSKRIKAAMSPKAPYLRFPFICESADEKKALLAESGRRGLGLNGMYPGPVSSINEIKDLLDRREFPGATRVSERLITLPTHSLLKKKDLENVLSLMEGRAATAANRSSLADETYNYN